MRFWTMKVIFLAAAICGLAAEGETTAPNAPSTSDLDDTVGAPAGAGQSQGWAKLVFHITEPTTTKNLCTSASPRELGCSYPYSSEVVVTGSVGSTYNVYLLLLDTNASLGVTGVTFALRYDDAVGSGVDILDWNRCGDLEFPSNGFPGSGGMNTVTWTVATNCQHYVDPTDPQGEGLVNIGFLHVYAYSQDLLEFEKYGRPVVPQVVDCELNESSPWLYTGRAGFGREGYDPCLGYIPVHPTTWTGIKRQK